jgi:hypothetical protein
MKKTLPLVGLIALLLWTGSYIFVYVIRSFRLPMPAEEATVYIWHGDPVTRAILAAILFAIGLILLLMVVVGRAIRGRAGSVPIRGDLWHWITLRAEETNDEPERIVARALAAYRDRVTGAGSDR